jgi:signal transduction histidine kinase
MIEYQEKLRNQASQLSLAEERERRRIATNLHDNIIQGLALSMIKLDILRETGESRGNRLLEEISRTLRHTIEDMRDMTFDISSPTLYRFGLSAAVDELMDDLLCRRHSIEYEFCDDEQEKPLDDDVRVLLFQSIRELLVNVIKHAGARKVRVLMERLGDSACITVQDDGVGFDADETHLKIHRAGGFGLFNIRERLDYIGGGMEIRSQPDEGSEFVLIAPLKNTVAQGKGIENGA